MYVENFPPEDDDGPFTPTGWTGDVNHVKSESTGEVYDVNHGQPETEPEQSDEE